MLAAFTARLSKLSQYTQRAEGRELIELWLRLQTAAITAGSYMAAEEILPEWARAQVQAALRTAGEVDKLREKVETLETRARARGVPSAAQPPTVTRPRKKPARKSKPKPALPVELQQPAPVS